MSFVSQFRSVTLIALTKSVDQTTVRVTSHSFNKLAMFRSVPIYILLVLYKVTFENTMDRTLSHHYLVTFLVHKQPMPVIGQALVRVTLLVLPYQL